MTMESCFICHTRFYYKSWSFQNFRWKFEITMILKVVWKKIHINYKVYSKVPILYQRSKLQWKASHQMRIIHLSKFRYFSYGMVIHVQLVTPIKNLNFQIFAKNQSGEETRPGNLLFFLVKLKCNRTHSMVYI